MAARDHRIVLAIIAFWLGLGLSAPTAQEVVSSGNRSKEFVIEPYYVFPADQSYHPEYEMALRDHIRQTRKWYQETVGRSLHVGKLMVVQSDLDYLTMRCGPAPTPGCISDREQLPSWLGSVLHAVGGLEQRTIKWIFAQGGGGYAGANLVQDFAGFAVSGDWVLEPISGLVDPEAIPCDLSDGWQCAIDANGNGAPYGTGPHELGHALGLHHPDGYSGMSLMKWHGDYPSTSLLAHEVMILLETPWLDRRAFDEEGPHLNFENQDVVHWGDSLWLSGADFSEGDEVEFRDTTHSVRVVANVIGPTLLQVTVPGDLGPGYMRIWRGDLRSNVVPINVHL